MSIVTLCTVEHDGITYTGVCSVCWARMERGDISFIHPSRLTILDVAGHQRGHDTWLDLNDDEKDCRVADQLAAAGVYEEQPDGSWQRLTGDGFRFA